MKRACATFAFLCALAVMLSVADAGIIKICANLAGQPVAGAHVECFDEDTLEDDFMVDGTTGTKGCATLTYETKSTSFWNCLKGWDGCVWSNPDIYCWVSAPCIAPKKTLTKNNQNQNVVANFGTVAVTTDAAFCGNVSWNGCGASALFPPWLMDIANSVSGFETSCNSHDVCYAGCSKSRAQCDSEFKANMYRQSNGNAARQSVADGFYMLVRTGGAGLCWEGRSICTAAQQESCYT
jgi:hypothetical protein